MSFEPSTSVYIGTVPWNPDYRHVRLFDSRGEQQSYMASRCPNELRRGDYTYQRVDNSIVVPFNAEKLYGYNYCMFQNANYGSRWFYAFIVNVEYVNPESTRLYLSTDIMQTWFLDCEVHACYVEREHVNDDTYGAHLKDEGLATGELKCVEHFEDEDNKRLLPVVSCAVEPNRDGTYVNVAGDVYDGVYSGTSLTVFSGVDQMKNFLQALADNGQQDSVAALYMVPKFCVSGRMVAKSDGYGSWLDSAAETPSSKVEVPFATGALDGYIPKNNKTLLFPNQYLEMTNYTGEVQQFRFEFFEHPATPSFIKTAGASPASTLMYIPVGYNGFKEDDRAVELSVKMQAFPTCTWVYQAYDNWIGQRTVRVDLPFGLGYRYESPDRQRQAALGRGLVDSVGDALDVASEDSKTKAAAGIMHAGSKLAATFDANTTAKEDLQYQQRQPNTSRGGLNDTTQLVNIDSYTVGLRHYQCRREFAEQIDNYYSMFGYNVSVTKVPNIRGRESWNYVKTQACNIVGQVPAPALAAINALFDRGITFWHVNAVGAYELPNEIIG